MERQGSEIKYKNIKQNSFGQNLNGLVTNSDKSTFLAINQASEQDEGDNLKIQIRKMGDSELKINGYSPEPH
jgi:hypothetical protein